MAGSHVCASSGVGTAAPPYECSQPGLHPGLPHPGPVSLANMRLSSLDDDSCRWLDRHTSQYAVFVVPGDDEDADLPSGVARSRRESEPDRSVRTAEVSSAEYRLLLETLPRT